MNYFDFIVYLSAGLLGILGHWWIRWSQDRTSNTFFQYLVDNKKYTVAAVVSIFGATVTLYSAINPPELSMELVLLSYLSGYKLDSVVNKDSTTPTVHKEVKKDEKISDIITKSRNN